MGRHRPLIAALLIVETLAGCARTSTGEVCPLVGVQTGIGLRIAAPVAEQVSTAEMVICWDATCQTQQVTIYPGSTVTDNGCAEGGPDAVCSAQSLATGAKVAFASIAGLPPSPVEVTLSLADAAGLEVVNETLTLTAKPVDAPGGNCGSGLQGHLAVDTDASVRSDA